MPPNMIRVVLCLLIVTIIVLSSVEPLMPVAAYNESGLISSTGNNYHPSVNVGDLISTNSKLKSDFGAINLGPASLKYNGTPKRTLIYGSGHLTQGFDGHVVGLAGNGVNGQPFLGYSISNSALPSGTGFSFASDAALQFDGYGIDPGRFSGSSIIGSTQSNNTYGVTGKGVTVAIVDTGTDFSNPDVNNTVARDSNNIPIMLDPDGQGLVLTKAVFAARIDEATGTIADYGFTSDSSLPKGATSYVFVNETGVYLKASHGNIPVFNPLYPYIGTPVINATANVDWKIGKSPTSYIRSISGMYHFGIILEVSSQTGALAYTLVPALVVDSKQFGVYDTIIPDMRSAFYFFAQDVLASQPQTAALVPSPVFDFTDQKRITIGDGNENLVYDYNHDGYPDFSAGTLGARVADLWQVINGTKKPVSDNNGGGFVAAKLLEPMDSHGEYFGVMYDMEGHGTSTAATVASKGTQSYSIYQGDNKPVPLRGMAPGAKILPIKALWTGDALYGWLYASGFDLNQDTGKWTYTGAHKADIVSNSWGISSFPLLEHGQGYDILSTLSSLLMIPKLFGNDYPGTLFVIAAGNDGIGYGSIGAPNSSPLAISVGATTNNVHLGYGPFANITRFGGSPQVFDQIADFSSRGPGIFGDPKPELMAVGEYGFTPWIVTDKTIHSTPEKPGNDKAYVLFGGTSMATPMVAGAAALVEEKLKDQGISPDPFNVKNILMSSAKDLENDPFVQGAGRVDALSALAIMNNSTGSFSAYTQDTVPNILTQMAPSLQGYNSTFSLFDNGQNLTKSVLNVPVQGEGRWYAGSIEQGASASTQIVINNPTNTPITIDATSQSEQLISRKQIQNTTVLSQKDPVRSNATQFGFAPNYFNVTKEFGPIPKDADLMVARINFPFKEFMNSSEVFANSLRIASVYAYDWVDANHDGKVSYNETTMVSRGGSWGTVEELRVADPAHQFSGTPLIGVYPVQTLFSFWSGDRHINSTKMNYTLTVDYYKRQTDAAVQVDSALGGVTIPPKQTAAVEARIVTTENTISGIYSSWIKISSSPASHTVLIPVSYIVTTKPVSKDIPVVVAPSTNSTSTLGLRPNGYVGGLFDMVSRYAAGDWRSYYFKVTDPTVTSMALKVSWVHNATSINVMAFGPDGKMIASSVPSGVFSTFAGWASNDWLGTTSASEGGGFYFSQNDGGNATLVHIPINGTGIYSVLLHNTLFDGSSLYEPVTLEAKFSTILPDTSAPIITAAIPKLIRGGVVSSVPVSIIEDDPAGFQYSIDGGAPTREQATSANISLDGSILSEGRHQIMIESTDTVGHSSSLSGSFIVDRTPPSISFYVKYPNMPNRVPVTGKVYVPKGTTLFWNVTDLNGVALPLEMSLPDMTHVSQNETASSISITQQQQQHVSSSNSGTGYVINATDLAGNRATGMADVILDDAVPKVSLTAPSGDVSGTIRLALNASDDDLQSVSLDLGGIRSINVTGMHEYSLNTADLPDGKYKVTLTALDSAGNNATATTSLSVVNFGPQLQQSGLLGLLIGAAVASGAWLALWRVRRQPAPQNLK